MNKKIIAIDAMGGDKAPKSVIAGLAVSAIRNPNFKYLIFGDKTKIAPLIKRRTNLITASEIIHTEDWVRNDEKALSSQNLKIQVWVKLLILLQKGKRMQWFRRK